MNKVQAYAIVLAVLLGISAILYVIITKAKGIDSVSVVPAEVSTPDIPPLTPEIEAMLQKSDGFTLLFSYTDSGFEPNTASIKKGQTARFTNNSGHDVWVAAQGTAEHPVYPAAGTCGQSSFDTCRVLHPKEFWEFTFTEVGTWQFVNNLNRDDAGTITVTGI